MRTAWERRCISQPSAGSYSRHEAKKPKSTCPSCFHCHSCSRGCCHTLRCIHDCCHTLRCACTISFNITIENDQKASLSAWSETSGKPTADAHLYKSYSIPNNKNSFTTGAQGYRNTTILPKKSFSDWVRQPARPLLCKIPVSCTSLEHQAVRVVGHTCSHPEQLCAWVSRGCAGEDCVRAVLAKSAGHITCGHRGPHHSSGGLCHRHSCPEHHK